MNIQFVVQHGLVAKTLKKSFIMPAETNKTTAKLFPFGGVQPVETSSAFLLPS